MIGDHPQVVELKSYDDRYPAIAPCSDGLSGMLTDEMIRAAEIILRRRPRAPVWVWSTRANEAGGEGQLQRDPHELETPMSHVG